MILGDKAIETPGEDRLNRSTFAEQMADGILKWNSVESLCMALHGPWGSGKTSVINLCLKSLTEKTKSEPEGNRPIIIRFQPWLFSGQEKLIRAFLAQLRQALKKTNLSEIATKAAGELEKYEKTLDFLSWLPIPGAGDKLEKMRKFIESLRKGAESMVQSEDLEAIKKSVDVELAKLPCPIVVVIDDVDRLTNEEIRQIFQLIKAVADFPRTIYLLAFDPNIVEKALEPFQTSGEANYLEKIIQLFFEVPNPSATQISQILLEGLQPIISEMPNSKEEQNRWNELRFGPFIGLFRNVRDVKRYLNTTNFIFPIIKGEISPTDLLIIEAIHIFAPKVYKVIKESKEVLTSDSHARLYRDRMNNESKEFVKSLTDLAPEWCKESVEEMLNLLFPEIESIVKNRGWGDGFREVWEKAQRVCMGVYFDHYFQGVLPEGEVSSKETKEAVTLLDNKDGLTLLFTKYAADDRLKKLVLKMEQQIGTISKEAAMNFISALLIASEEAPLKPDSLFFGGGVPFDWAIQGLIYRLLKKFDAAERKNIFIAALDDAVNAVSFPIAFISQIWREWYPREGKEQPAQKLLTEAETKEIKDKAIQILEKNLQEGNLHKTRHLLSILFDWERWVDNTAPQKAVEKMIEQDRDLPQFLVGCGGFSSSATMGSHFSTSTFKIDPKHLGRFCNVEELKMRCEKLVANIPEGFTENDVKVLNIFLDGFKKKSEFDDD